MSTLGEHIGAWLMVAIMAGGLFAYSELRDGAVTRGGSQAQQYGTPTAGPIDTLIKEPRRLGWQPSADLLGLPVRTWGEDRRLVESEPSWLRRGGRFELAAPGAGQDGRVYCMLGEDRAAGGAVAF
jgi:hypothetical protein